MPEGFRKPSGYEDALYRTLGLVVRQLHANRFMEAPELIREMRLLAGQLDDEEVPERDCIAGIQGMAASFERELPRWDEAREVRDLYRGQSDR